MQQRMVGLVVAMCLLVSGAAALVPDDITITSSKGWVVASGADTATITVVCCNGTALLKDLKVEFSTNPIYGQMNPAGKATNAHGEASSTFKVAEKSGTAPITVRIQYKDNDTLYTTERVFPQEIDHDKPYRISHLYYQSEVTVGETSTITVGLSDAHGNPIDSRNVAESVRFTVGSPSGNAEFLDAPPAGYPVNKSGYVTATLKTDTVAGANIVLIEPPSPIPGRYITISGLGNAAPSTIALELNSTPYLPANGVSKFYLTYTLSDQYGNPAGNRSVWINTSIGGEDRILTTNSFGQIKISYGPKDSTGKVILTATSVDNPAVNVSQELEFHSTAPVNMLLSASPQTMASRDVNPDIVASIRAKVMDIKGNPVAGESVSFSISGINAGMYLQTQIPELDNTSVVTDADGYAVVGFRPGAFTTDREHDNFSRTANGTCNVVATWAGTTVDIPLTWKNYPYLSVETEVVPETVAVNDTIDVTIRLKGDGWALQPDPIDVVLVIDKSLSMDEKDMIDEDGKMISRLTAAKSAAITFVNQMSTERDQIGVVSYSTSASLDLGLSKEYSTVIQKINGLSPVLYTATRHALKLSIEELIKKPNPDPDAVQAVILMTDGEFNYYGDPLARGTGYNQTNRDSRDQWYKWTDTSVTKHTWFEGLGGRVKLVNYNINTHQNMALYAKDHGIRLYTISFSNDITPGSTTWETMETLSRETGATHYHAETADSLTSVYTDIAGELKTEAGINTEMDVDFKSVPVNGVPIDGHQVFEYIYVPDRSTRISSSKDGAPLFPAYVRDDTANWTGTDPGMHFDIGTIRLNQMWETSFCFKVLKPGNINIFGGGSTITFNNGTDMLALPDTFVTAIPELNNTGVNFTELAILNLESANPGQPVTDFLTVTWDVKYTGTESVTEEVFYSNDGGLAWIKFDTRALDHATFSNSVRSDSTRLDVRNLPAGQYVIRVYAFAPDTPDDQAETEVERGIDSSPRKYIKIQ